MDDLSLFGRVYKRLKDMGDGSHAEVVVTAAGGAIASDGTLLNIESLPQTLSYNVDNTLNYIQVTAGGNTYRQTLTYTNGNVTAISQWVKQ